MGRGKNPLILGLNGLSYFDVEQKFLNLIKCGGGNFQQNPWGTDGPNGDTHEAQYLAPVLDPNGYPTSMTVPGIPGGQKFVSYSLFVNRALDSPRGSGLIPPGASALYPPGTYRFKGTGQCTLEFSFDAGPLTNPTGGATVNGQQVTHTGINSTFTVDIPVPTPSAGGIVIRIKAIPSATDYPRDWSLVHSSQAAAFDAGAIFSPRYLSAIQASGASILRFMDFLNTGGQVTQYAGLGPTQVIFAVSPKNGDTTAPLVNPWPLYSGTYLITIKNGQSFLASFNANSTAVAFNGTVSSNCADGTCHLHAQKNWADRPLPANANYLSWKGAPAEIALALCNACQCDAWINVPLSFTAPDWANLASLVLATLNPALKCYVEISNEVWNFGTFDSGPYCREASQQVFATADEGSFYGRQVALVADQFALTAGNPAFDQRFAFVISGQDVNPDVLVHALTAPAWTGNTPPYQRTSASGQKTIKHPAIANYLGSFNLPPADFAHLTGLPDGGFTDFFKSCTQNPVNGYTFTYDGTNALPAGGWSQHANSALASTLTALAPYGLQGLLCYEGGWGFVGAISTAQLTFFETACRDTRLAAIYTAYLNAALADGATPAQFVLGSADSNFGHFGALENMMQSITPLSSAPPKFQGLAAFTGASMSTVTIQLPTTRIDGSALPLSDLTSCILSKQTGTAAPVVVQTFNGPFTSNTLTFATTPPAAGTTDTYSAILTDTNGNVSGPGTASVTQPATPVQPPSPPIVSFA